MPRIVVAQAQHGERDALGDDHQKSVLKEQRVAFDLAAIDQLQQLRPQLPFQRDGWIVLPAPTATAARHWRGRNATDS